uniref:Putative secreted protein n=1 Tax=Ixodes ricinus TaxID=34613 RepID=A0A6B0UN54_IXORI
MICMTICFLCFLESGYSRLHEKNPLNSLMHQQSVKLGSKCRGQARETTQSTFSKQYICFSSLSHDVNYFLFVGSIFRTVSLSRKSGGREIWRSRAIFNAFTFMDDLFFAICIKLRNFPK